MYMPISITMININMLFIFLYSCEIKNKQYWSCFRLRNGSKRSQQMKGYIRWDASSYNKCTSMASERSKMKYPYISLSSKFPTSFSARAGIENCVEPARTNKCIPSLLQEITIPVPTWKTDETTSLKVVWYVDLRLGLTLIIIVGLLLQNPWETFICKHFHICFANQVLIHRICTKSTKAL